MCGIVAVVRKRTDRQTPDASKILELSNEALTAFPLPSLGTDPKELLKVAELLGQLNVELAGEAGLRCLLNSSDLGGKCAVVLDELFAQIKDFEAFLETDGDKLKNLEDFNAAIVSVKDASWSVRKDRLRAAVEVIELLGDQELADSAIPWLFSLQQTLSNIDRLEVRGRDSAGVNVLVHFTEGGLETLNVQEVIEERSADPLYKSGSVRLADGCLSFVYKAAAEIGELGDNTAAIRKAISSDDLLHEALAAPDAVASVLAHTRWASIGIISEPNAHPVNSEETENTSGPFLTAVCNGDVDNFAEIKMSEELKIATEITTDTKVIPTVIRRNLESGLDLDEAVRKAMTTFEGSTAIGVSSASAPHDLHLALRGSGQGVYIGLAEDAFIIASEPYGVVEDATRYLRMDGEALAHAGNPGSQGQIVRLTGAAAGEASSVLRVSYDGTSLPVTDEEWKEPAVTTRDIDRGDAPHFLLKEISESPTSFRKTLRGRLVSKEGNLDTQLSATSMNQNLLDYVSSGDLKRVEVIGQGTAAVAGQAIAAAIAPALQHTEALVRAITATELSGFQIRADMSDTLVVAVSQSGTTTDTNRTVDVVRARGAKVIAIVNRRGSDLADKSDGVIYTSDGRDVEMSVASTKAFYAQIAAGFLLADRLGQLTGAGDSTERQELLAGLRDMPELMAKTLTKRSAIATAAATYAPGRRYWAIVGNGENKIAAEEIRIKLSELCYKAIACDVTEDKKHIDLSSEPLILVCAAGLVGSNVDDVAKEVAIFKAHKAAPIVVASEGENRFTAALDVIAVPQAHSALAFILSTMVGHLFGYEAALAIDASAKPLREIRGAIEEVVEASTNGWFPKFGKAIEPMVSLFWAGLQAGDYNGSLEAATATRVTGLLRFASGAMPLDQYQREFGVVGTPGVVVEELSLALTSAIEELTRPVDAIKHQAKTVTVGISRADESLLQSTLTQSVLEAGAIRDSLSYKTLRTLAAVAPTVNNVLGYTKYRIVGFDSEAPQLSVVSKGGIAEELTSRAETDPVLRGTKRRVAFEQVPIVTVGTDSRTVIIVPEVQDGQTVGLTLCHLDLVPKLDSDTARSVLTNYRNRYRQLVDVVQEKHPTFDHGKFENVATVDLLTAPISEVAENWI